MNNTKFIIFTVYHFFENIFGGSKKFTLKVEYIRLSKMKGFHSVSMKKLSENRSTKLNYEVMEGWVLGSWGAGRLGIAMYIVCPGLDSIRLD